MSRFFFTIYEEINLRKITFFFIVKREDNKSIGRMSLGKESETQSTNA